MMLRKILLTAVLVLAPLPAFALCEVLSTGSTFGLGTVLQAPPCDTSGGMWVHLRTAIKGEDQTNDVMKTEHQFMYETVAASQTNQVLGTTGGANDLIHRVVCVATAASAAAVTLKDGSGTAFNIFPIFSAAGSYFVELNMKSTLGAWQLTTSTNTTCIGVGRFAP